MRTRELEKILKKLKDMREDILREIEHFDKNQRDGVREVEGEVSTYNTHPADMSSIAQEREKAFLLASHNRQVLKQINNAIERINNGTFGVCEVCGEKIDVERLSLIPFANLCLSCKSKLEKK